MPFRGPSLKFVIILAAHLMPVQNKYHQLAPGNLKKAMHLKRYPKPFVLQKMPQRGEWDQHLIYLESIIKFFHQYRKAIDLNVYIGLFFANVHLQSLLKEMDRKISDELKLQIWRIERKSYKIVELFGRKVNKKAKGNTQFRDGKDIYRNLLTNVAEWRDRMRFVPAFLSKEFKIQGGVELKESFGSWKNFSKVMLNEKNIKPSHDDLDKCLGQLARHPVKMVGFAIFKEPICNFNTSNDMCHNAVTGGGDKAYSLRNRILLLTMAFFGKGCKIQRGMDDRTLVHQLCKLAFAEVDFLSQNRLRGIDLILEHIALCSLNGYYGFYMYQNKKWLARLLQFQKPMGCFTDSINKMPPTTIEIIHHWQLKKPKTKQTLQAGRCNGQVTGMAAAALASVARTLIMAYHQ